MCTSRCAVAWTNKPGKDPIAFKHMWNDVENITIRHLDWTVNWLSLKSDQFPVKVVTDLISEEISLTERAGGHLSGSPERAPPGILRWSTCVDPLTGRAAAAGGSSPLESLRWSTVTARKVGDRARAEGTVFGGRRGCCSPPAVSSKRGPQQLWLWKLEAQL